MQPREQSLHLEAYYYASAKNNIKASTLNKMDISQLDILTVP